MRHRKGLGPYFNHRETSGQLLEGNIGGRGSDSGTAGGDSGNYGDDGSGSGGSSRSSDRFNSGGGGGSDPDPFETVRGAVSDIGGAASDAVDTVTSPVTDPVTDAIDFVTSGPDEASVGDPGFNDPGTVDTQPGGNNTNPTTVDPGPGAPQSTYSDVGAPDITADPTIIDNATDSGGFLAENRTDTSAVLPGEIGGVDISEDRVYNSTEDIGTAIDQRVTGAAANASVGPASTPFGRTVADAGGNLASDALAGAPRAIEGTTEFVQNAPLSQQSVVTAGSTGVDVAQATARSARQNPATFAAETALSFGAGAAGGRALGTAGRAARQSSTRIGGTRIDPNDLVNEQTLRYAEGDINDPEAQFPGAADEELYQTDPAESVRQQAGEYTPEEIEQRFDEAGVDDGTDLKKAVDTNPEGPAVGRGNTGLETREGSYESPGGFAGPELSPNFLRVGDRSPDFSLRPGLPDFGSDPTGVVVRTDVENPDADTIDEFNQELLDAEGETTARTKPAGEVNPGEAEAVIPPEAEFAPVRGGLGSRARSRLGVGSDFYTEINGQPVRIQTAADPDLVGDSGRRRFFGDGDDRGQVTAPDGRRSGDVGDPQRLSELRRRGDPGTDRPLPFAGGTSPVSSGFGSSPSSSPSPRSPAPSNPESTPLGGGSLSSGGQPSSGSDRSLSSSTPRSPTSRSGGSPSGGSPSSGSPSGGSPAGGSGVGGGSGGGTPTTPRGTSNRPRPDTPDIDGEPSEEEFDITGVGDLFDSGIASGREQLRESFGLDGDQNDRFIL